MICPKCGYIGEDPFCSKCGTAMVPEMSTEEQHDDEIFRKVAQGLSDSVNETMENAELGEAAGEDAELRLMRFQKTNEYTEYEEDDDRFDDEESDEYEDEDPGEYDDDRRQSIRRGAERAASWSKDAVGAAGEAVGKGLKTAWEILCNILRIVSAILMGAVGVYMAWVFLGEVRSIGTLSELIGGTSKALTVYAGGAAVLVLFAGIQVLWILIRSRKKEEGIVRRIDKGHGLFAFALYTLIALVSGAVLVVLPEREGVIAGVRGLCHAFQTMGNPFWMISSMGLILCFLRKICSSL